MNQGVSTLNVCYYTGTKLSDGRPESTTILNDMVLLENDGNFSDEPSKDKIGCIEYLLNNGADINFTNVGNPVIMHTYWRAKCPVLS